MSYGLTQKWRHIADVIRSEIDRQLYRPGDQLPTVVILAERFGVNRHTVRRALDSLQQSGLVSMEQGRGTFVADTRVAHRPPHRLALGLSARPLDALASLATHQGHTGFGTSQPLISHQRLVLEKIQPTAEICALFQATETEAFWHLRILTHLGHDPLCISNHYLRVRRFADLDASLLREGHDLAASLAEHGFNQIERQETSLQATMATPDQKYRLELSDNQPLLVTSGLDRDGKTQEMLQYVVTAWPAQRIYFLHDQALQPSVAMLKPGSAGATRVGGLAAGERTAGQHSAAIT
jgi:GntR family phosphonate transport system transcriptional regulator